MSYKTECTDKNEMECRDVYKTVNQKKKQCKTTYKEECKPSYNYEKKCTKTPHESCEYVDVPKKVKNQECRYVTKKDCKHVPKKECQKVQFYQPTKKRNKECQKEVKSYKMEYKTKKEKECENIEVPKCETKYKEQ